jgi:hypothetical protein
MMRRILLPTKVLIVSCCLTSALAAAGAGTDVQLQRMLPRVRLTSEHNEALLRRFLPAVDSQKVQQVLADPSLILYTEAEMPRAYQHWQGDLQGIHSPSYNISAVAGERFGNGNQEFPWVAPAGTHRTSGLTSLRFLWLPRDEAGDLLPVVWYRKRLAGDTSVGYAWTFPVGAVVGEVLGLRGPDGHDYAFELRIRVRQSGDWAVDVFRPFPRATDLAERIKQLRPEWETQPSLAGMVRHLQQPMAMSLHTLSDHMPLGNVFRQAMGVDVLPPLDDDQLIIQLLTQTPFKSALGELWRVSANGNYTCAPTTAADFHIVPANYDAGFIAVDSISCMRCHETTNQHVDRFDPSRDWYGRIRGSDGIFSFHPFDPSTVSYNGYGNRVSMRSELVEGGALEPYNQDKHSNAIYNQVPFLED